MLSMRRPRFVHSEVRPALALPLLLILVAGCTGDVRRSSLRLAVTTSTRDSGLLDVLLPVFEQQSGVRTEVIAVGTGAALKLGQAGDVDVVLVHARAAEDAFMAARHGIRREDVMYNSFEILGPADDPAQIQGTLPTQAFQRIAAAGERFVSRGDESGTHQREETIWEDAGGRPNWTGHVESGQGMGATLTMADQMEAYVLSDRGTYLKFKRKIQLVPLVSSAESLRNAYGVLVVNPQKHSHLNTESAQRFVDFMISPDAQRRIRDYEIDGERLFYPLHPAASADRGMSLIREGGQEAIRLLVRFDPLVLDAAYRSLCISLFAVALATLVGLPLGTLLARVSFPAQQFVVLACRAGMAFPTVFVGIVCYALFSRRGPLGPSELLYTPWAIVCGEFLLAAPLVISISHGAVKALDPRIGETAWTLGAGPIRRWRTYISEARVGVTLAVLTAFSRCVTELGIAMMVGGNIKYRTRTLATATAMETGKGEFGRGLAMGLILLAIALSVALLIVVVSRENETSDAR